MPDQTAMTRYSLTPDSRVLHDSTRGHDTNRRCYLDGCGLLDRLAHIERQARATRASAVPEPTDSIGRVLDAAQKLVDGWYSGEEGPLYIELRAALAATPAVPTDLCTVCHQPRDHSYHRKHGRSWDVPYHPFYAATPPGPHTHDWRDHGSRGEGAVADVRCDAPGHER